MAKKNKEIPISRLGRKLHNQKVKLTYKTFVKLTIFIWTLLLVLCPIIPIIYILNNLQSPIIFELLTTIPLLMRIEFIAAPTLAIMINALLISTRKVLFQEHKDLYKVERKIAALKSENEKDKLYLTEEQVKNLGTFQSVTQPQFHSRTPIVASQNPQLSGRGARKLEH